MGEWRGKGGVGITDRAGIGIKDEGGIMEEGGSMDRGIMNKGAVTKEGTSLMSPVHTFGRGCGCSDGVGEDEGQGESGFGGGRSDSKRRGGRCVVGRPACRVVATAHRGWRWWQGGT